jgi:hypothetical protein
MRRGHRRTHLRHDLIEHVRFVFRVPGIGREHEARLEQEGKIRLSDPILTYLGDDKLVAGIPNIDKITVGDIMAMKSGIADYLGTPTSISRRSRTRRSSTPRTIWSRR